MKKEYIEDIINRSKYYKMTLSKINNIENQFLKELHLIKNNDVNQLYLSKFLNLAKIIDQVNDIITSLEVNYWQKAIVNSKRFIYNNKDTQLLKYLCRLDFHPTYDDNKQQFHIEFRFNFESNNIINNIILVKSFTLSYDYEINDFIYYNNGINSIKTISWKDQKLNCLYECSYNKHILEMIKQDSFFDLFGSTNNEEDFGSLMYILDNHLSLYFNKYLF